MIEKCSEQGQADSKCYTRVKKKKPTAETPLLLSWMPKNMLTGFDYQKVVVIGERHCL